MKVFVLKESNQLRQTMAKHRTEILKKKQSIRQQELSLELLEKQKKGESIKRLKDKFMTLTRPERNRNADQQFLFTE
jgi:flagellar biosynthesis chaperone FliJ